MSLNTVTFAIPDSFTLFYPSAEAVVFSYFAVGVFTLLANYGVGYVFGYEEESEGLLSFLFILLVSLFYWPVIIVALFMEESEYGEEGL